jgi:hypothetical protein
MRYLGVYVYEKDEMLRLCVQGVPFYSDTSGNRSIDPYCFSIEILHA